MDWLYDKDGNFIPTLTIAIALFIPFFAVGWILGCVWSGIRCGFAAGEEPPK